MAELEAIVKEHDGTLARDLSDERLTHVVVADDWHRRSDNVVCRSCILHSLITKRVLNVAYIHFLLNRI